MRFREWCLLALGLLHHPRASFSFFSPGPLGRIRTGRALNTAVAPIEVESPASRGNQEGVWLPVVAASATLWNKEGESQGPVSVEVAGRKLAVWKASDATGGSWSVMEDACPHRCAPLSEGRITEGGCIACPYHGWAFDSTGTCTAIPQNNPGAQIACSATQATSLPVRVTGDVVWAWFGDLDWSGMSFTDFPESEWPFLNTTAPTTLVRDLPYSFDMLVENFMDPAHIPFAHHGLQGVREDGSPIPMQLLSTNSTVVEVAFQDRVRGKDRDCIMAFRRPVMYYYSQRDTADANSPHVINLAMLCVPVHAGACRLFITYQQRTGLTNKIPTWLLHALSNRFLNTDVWLHEAELVHRNQNKPYVFWSESDNGVKHFRRWWKSNGMAESRIFGPAPPGLTEATAAAKLSYKDSHRKNCAICSKKLTQVKRLEEGSVLLALLPIALGLGRPARLAGVGAFLMLRAGAKGARALLQGPAGGDTQQ
ncbi:unnamed protein product [Chrysoparadoxa australica]